MAVVIQQTPKSAEAAIRFDSVVDELGGRKQGQGIIKDDPPTAIETFIATLKAPQEKLAGNADKNAEFAALLKKNGLSGMLIEKLAFADIAKHEQHQSKAAQPATAKTNESAREI